MRANTVGNVYGLTMSLRQKRAVNLQTKYITQYFAAISRYFQVYDRNFSRVYETGVRIRERSAYILHHKVLISQYRYVQIYGTFSLDKNFRRALSKFPTEISHSGADPR